MFEAAGAPLERPTSAAISSDVKARVIDPAAIADSYRAELREEVAGLPEPLTLLGLLAEDHGPSATYAEYTRKGCDDVGIRFELRRVQRGEAESVLRAAGGDRSVHGILVYYPVSGPGADGWLRELVDPRKDVEGLHSFWARCLYENRRYLDAERTQRAILPSTPLAILKLIEAAGVSRPSASQPLAGVKACVFNRSEVVGQPLAAMMANDGAEVISFDLEGPQRFVRGAADVAQRMQSIETTREAALAEADVVITGVPSRAFPRVCARELKAGAVCLNFSTFRNFEEDVSTKASVFIPRVGPMTVTMALRNTIRLYRQGCR